MRRKKGTSAHRQLSIVSSIAAKVSVCESPATPGSVRYPSYWPRTTFEGSQSDIARSTFTVSSRSRFGSKETGGSIARNVSIWKTCVETMSRMAPVCS